MGPFVTPAQKVGLVAVVLVTAILGWTLGSHALGGKSSDDDGLSSNGTISTKGWVTDTDKTSGVMINHPKAWKAAKSQGVWALYVDDASVVKKGKFRRNIVIQSEDFSGSLTDYTTMGIKLFQQLGGANAVTESGDSTLAGQPAHHAVYTFPDRVNNKTDKALATWTLKNGKAYVVTYTSEATTFDEALPTVNAVLGTVRLP
jgi:hypothetical protein